jgi:hypothetical protein
MARHHPILTNVSPLRFDAEILSRMRSEVTSRFLLWDRWACEGEREPEAKEVHRHPRRWRSLPALWGSHASPRVRRATTPAVFLHPLVLLHEQDLQNHVGDARTL